MNDVHFNYGKAVINRIKWLMEKAGLQLPAFAEFTGVSESHLYAILNGNKPLTGKIADQLAKKFNLKGWQLLHLEYEIPVAATKSQLLQEFYEDYRHAKNYFTDDVKLKNTRQLEKLLLNGSFLKKKRFTAEILAHCSEYGIIITSKQLSQHLHYLTQKKILQKEKQLMRLKSGALGTREVDVFWL